MSTKKVMNQRFMTLSGADTQIRTGDLILTKDALYRLSYISMLPCGSLDNISQRAENVKGKSGDYCKIFIMGLKRREKGKKNDFAD